MKKILIYTVVSHATLLLLSVGNTECSQNITMKSHKKTTDTENCSKSFKPESYIMAMANQNKKSLKKNETDVSNLTERITQMQLSLKTPCKPKIIRGTLTELAPKTGSKANQFYCSDELMKKIEGEAKDLYKEQIEQKQKKQCEIIKIINMAIDSLKSQEPCKLPNRSIVFYKPNTKAPLAINFTRMLKALPYNIDKKLLLKFEEEQKTFEEQLKTIAKMFKNKSEKYKQQLKSINDDTGKNLNTPVFKKYVKTISTYLQIEPSKILYKKYNDNPVKFFTKYRKDCFDQLDSQIIVKYYTYEDETKNSFVKEVLDDQFKFTKN